MLPSRGIASELQDHLIIPFDTRSLTQPPKLIQLPQVENKVHFWLWSSDGPTSGENQSQLLLRLISL